MGWPGRKFCLRESASTDIRAWLVCACRGPRQTIHVAPGGSRNQLSERSNLGRVMDERFMRESLEREVLARHEKGVVSRCEVRKLRSSLRKIIIQYVVHFKDRSTRTYIGVHRESDERLERGLSILKLLRSKGFDERSDLRVPKPVGYFPHLSLLLMEPAEGELVRELFERRVANLEKYLERVALWLAKLHSSDANFGRLCSLQDQIAASLRYKRPLPLLFPDLASRLESVSARIVKLQQAFPDLKVRPIHGDFHPKNVFASNNSVTAIDFEMSCMGDPAFDLGYFVAQAKMTHEKIYEAQTYFQRIYHTYWVLKLDPQPDIASAWLSESESCIESLGEPPS
ncbi:MAG: aminoglycoside phosphotransferase family protein [Thaumarchaeota archaeon]|nr:MAG: aminoglycoside phosphotransferase family protein [Nitrososphaerota archaeon]